MLICIT